MVSAAFHEKAVNQELKFTSTFLYGGWIRRLIPARPEPSAGGTGIPPAPLGDGRGEVPLRGFRGDPQAVKLASAWRGPGRQPRSFGPGAMRWDLAFIRTLLVRPVGSPVHDLIRVSIHWEKGGTLLSC